MTEPLKIGPQREITLHFAVLLESGEEVDSTFDGEPATFVWGDESLPEGFERSLLGLKAGDKRSVSMGPEQGFGEVNPENILHFRREEFPPEDELAPGVVMQFTDAAKAELPGVIKSVDEEWVTVDFNHPLAGRNLTFVVEIIDVKLEAKEQIIQLR
ncbi:MAG TPA: FKBP-type peptidyl-prolyl cis-trans isomerase [Alcanivoracaceae bacterium]|nr:FKBP-type peptidyl-prolyl cis-trans isomerase [Alcanivoracaceae bacterium]